MRLAAALLALSCVAVAPRIGLADHTDEERITDLTAYTLDDNEWRIGLWKLEYGITDTISVGTYTFPWAIKMASATTKWNFWRSQQKDNQLAAGIRLGFYTFDLASLGGPSTRLNIVPVELVGSYRRHVGMSMHGGFIFTNVSVSGGSPDDDSLRGGAAGDSTQIFGQVEWRWGQHTAFLTELRILTSQELSATTDVTNQIDPYTTIRVAARAGGDVADAEQFKRAGFISGTFHWSWGGWNLKTGLVYGNFIVPAANIVLPGRIVYPELDLYYRF